MDPARLREGAGILDSMNAANTQRRILIGDSVDVARPLAVVAARCLEDPRWLSPVATSAEHRARTVRVGPLGERILARQVSVEVRGVMRRGNGLVAWIEWKAADSALLPVLDAELELTERGPSGSRLTLSGSYLPPLGALGRGLDWAVMHRIAQITVCNFLHELSDGLCHDSQTVGARTPERRRGPALQQERLAPRRTCRRIENRSDCADRGSWR